MQQQKPNPEATTEAARSTRRAPIAGGNGTPASSASAHAVVPMPAPAETRTRPRGAVPATPAVPAVGAARASHIRTIAHRGLTWVDITHPGESEIEWLRRNYGFHPLHLDDTVSKIQRPKIDDDDDYTFIVMHFPVYSKLVRVTTPSEVDLFVGANYLITVHAGTLRPLVRLFSQCLEDPKARDAIMGRSSGYLLYQVVDKLVDNCFPILNKIDQNIEQAEDQIFEDKVRKTILEISIIRRDVIAFRRIIKPLIPVVASLERKQRPFLNEEMEEYFGDISDHLSKIWDTLEDYKEVIEGLSDTITSLTNNRINEIIKVLTMISVILLPLTLISGICGMNIWLPFADNPFAIGVVIGVMVVIALAMLAFFKSRKWF
ncbi:MAG TPA: magnesium/cobalt transporter CorA [Chloroflexia bacterium]|nr:magnesium/cobalt transporter CorA [Chloroflexia bacterium]